jgi:hypothetical protein
MGISMPHKPHRLYKVEKLRTKNLTHIQHKKKSGKLNFTDHLVDIHWRLVSCVQGITLPRLSRNLKEIYVQMDDLKIVQNKTKV